MNLRTAAVLIAIWVIVAACGGSNPDDQSPEVTSDAGLTRTCSELERVANERMSAMIEDGASEEEVDHYRQEAEAERIRLRETAIEAGDTTEELVCENVNFLVYETFDTIGNSLTDP